MTTIEDGDGISLNVHDQQPDTHNVREGASRHRDSDRMRAFALVGSALSQLPIWGIFTHPVHGAVSSQTQALL